jgi:hypothetical protein
MGFIPFPFPMSACRVRRRALPEEFEITGVSDSLAPFKEEHRHSIQPLQTDQQSSVKFSHLGGSQ